VQPHGKDGHNIEERAPSRELGALQIEEVDMGIKEEEENNGTSIEDATQESEASPICKQYLLMHFNQTRVLNTIRIAASGIFPHLPEDETNRHLGPAKDLYICKNYLRRLVMLHGGMWIEWVTKNIHWLVIGEKPGKTKVEKATDYRIHLITYELLLKVIEGSLTANKLDNKREPKILSYSKGTGPHWYNTALRLPRCPSAASNPRKGQKLRSPKLLKTSLQPRN
jgi:hypothetical protein